MFAVQGIHANPLIANTSLQNGDVVPLDGVCMGKDQVELNHDGKLYYGCFEMCRRRIPQDERDWVATDPDSNGPVAKAMSVIAITVDKGEV